VVQKGERIDVEREVDSSVVPGNKTLSAMNILARRNRNIFGKATR
jgi:hypothetical protein